MAEIDTRNMKINRGQETPHKGKYQVWNELSQ